VVEHDLAKVGVEGSSPFARSNFRKSKMTKACGIGGLFVERQNSPKKTPLNLF
jgi:hypothetical protein